MLKPPYPLILERLNQGKVIPFLGAGASLGGRAAEDEWRKGETKCLPNGTELATYLAQKSEFPENELPSDLAKVAQYYDVVGGRTPLQEELHGIFDCDYPISPLHLFLADIPAPLLIVTTNYDDLIERAFKAKARPYDLVIHTTDAEIGNRLLWCDHRTGDIRKVLPNRLDIDLSAVTVIYKMHGAIDRRNPKQDQYVITEDDYIDFLTRMINNKAVPSIFTEPFATRHFLFLGYGLRDWNLRVVLNRIEKRLCRKRDIKSWAIQSAPSELERRFWLEHDVEIFDNKLDVFLQEITRARAER